MFGPYDSCLGRKKQHILACCNNWRHATEWFYVGAQQYFRNTIHTGFGGCWKALIFSRFSAFVGSVTIWRDCLQWNTPKKQSQNHQKSCRQKKNPYRQNHMFGPYDSCLGRKKQHILACCNDWSHATEWFYVGAQQYFRNTIHTGFGGGWNALIFFSLLPFSPFLSASILKKLLPNQLKSCRRHSATQRQQPAKRHIHVFDRRNSRGSLQEPNQPDWLLLREGWANCKNPFTKFLAAVGKRWYSLAFPPLSVSVTIWRDCLSVKQLEETITESPEIMPAEKEPLQAKSHVWSLWFMSTKETTHFGLLQQLKPCNRMILRGCSANFRNTIHTGFGGGWNALIFFWLLPFSPFLSASILKKLWPNQLKSCRRHSATQRQQPAKRHIHVFDQRNSRGLFARIESTWLTASAWGLSKL